MAKKASPVIMVKFLFFFFVTLYLWLKLWQWEAAPDFFTQPVAPSCLLTRVAVIAPKEAVIYIAQN